ncbi:MAG: LamG-like jellyroll fold domain-containing protein [Planctomycetota bacterium]
MRRVILLSLVGLLAWPCTLSAATLFKLDFQDPGAAVGDAFSSTTNAGTVTSAPAGVTRNGGQVLYTQGPGGAGDLAVQFVDANVPGGSSNKGGTLEVYNWPIPTGDFTMMYAFRHDAADNHKEFDRVFEGWNGSGVSDAGGISNTLVTPTTMDIDVGARGYNFVPTPDTWYHLAVVFDYLNSPTPGRSSFKLYINGSEVSVNLSQFAFNPINPGGVSQTVYFGSQYHGHRPWSGAIDDVVYTDSLLSADDIEAAYEASFTGPQTDDPVIPEPASMGLVLMGFVGLGRYLRRRHIH